MPVGFQLWGSHGLLQIDDSYSNLALVAKGTVQRNGATTSALVPVTVTVQNPMVAVSSPGCFVYLANSVNNGDGTWTFYFGFRYNEAAAAVTYYVFGVPPVVSSSKFGLQIFRADGALAFDSNFPYLVANNFIQIADTTSPNAAPDYTVTPSISKYAWILGDPGSALQGVYYLPPSGLPVAGVYTGSKWMAQGGAGTSFTLGLRFKDEPQPSPPAGSNPSYFPSYRRPQSVLLLDVTNF